MPVAASNGTAATIATVAVVAAADITGLSALEPHWAAILASTVGAVAGTVIVPMMQNKPIRPLRVVIGYVLFGLVVTYITYDLTPPDFAAISQLPNAEEFWAQSTAFRHTVLTFAITQIRSITPFLRLGKGKKQGI